MNAAVHLEAMTPRQRNALHTALVKQAQETEEDDAG